MYVSATVFVSPCKSALLCLSLVVKADTRACNVSLASQTFQGSARVSVKVEVSVDGVMFSSFFLHSCKCTVCHVDRL